MAILFLELKFYGKQYCETVWEINSALWIDKRQIHFLNLHYLIQQTRTLLFLFFQLFPSMSSFKQK